MQNKSAQLPLIYRSYRFDNEFPVFLMQETEPTSEAVFMHFHNCIEIAICEESMKKWSIEGREYFFLPGDIFFIPPFTTHLSYRPEDSSGPALYSYIFFNPEEALKPFYPNGLPPEMLWFRYVDFTNKIPIDDFQKEIGLIFEMKEQLLKRPRNYQLFIQGILQSLMVSFSRYYMEKNDFQNNKKPLSRILPAVSYLNENYQQTISSFFLAEISHMNQKQFLKEFGASMRQTPSQYQNALRIQKACDLLTRTEDSILDIALEVGFQSVSTFNRSFRNILNTNPQNFRNSKRHVIKKNLRYSNFDSTN